MAMSELTFSGEPGDVSFGEWIELRELHFKIDEVEEDALKKDILARSLRGKAAGWLKPKLDQYAEWDYARFCRELEKEFSEPLEEQQKIFRLLQVRQEPGESFKNFTSRVRKVAVSMRLLRLYEFVVQSNCLEEYSSNEELFRCKTYDEWERRVLKEEQDKNDRRALREKEKQHQKNLHQQKKKFACYQCGQIGHRAANCQMNHQKPSAYIKTA